MVAKSKLKLIKKLHQKKYRIETQLFFVEGIKVVNELLKEGLQPNLILATKDKWKRFSSTKFLEEIHIEDLKKVSALKNPNGVLGVFHLPKTNQIDFNNWVVALDGVQDPGNLGTIIRICDWFGINHLVCSTDSVECYNPKVLQATMGSIARINMHYLDLGDLLAKAKVPVYGAFMDGETVYHETFEKPGVLVMGNEGNGISDAVEKYITKRVSIPQFGSPTAESLNVAVATSILLNEVRRG